MASLEIIDYVVIGIYLLTIVIIGVILEKKASTSIESYFLGSRQLPFWALAASGIASNIDISGTAINTALIFAFGIQGFYIEFRGGVTLSLALFMIFGKWTRRSCVMTMAEWMELRFGKNRQGDAARIATAIALIFSTIIQTTYFAIGAGKFMEEFIQLPNFLGIPSTFWGAAILTGLAMIYTVTSGLAGVVWTDVLQGILVFIAVVIVVIISWVKSNVPSEWTVHLPPSFNQTVHYEDWVSPFPDWKIELPSSQVEASYSSFEYLGLVILFYFTKALLEGFSGPSGYTAQRYFSVDSDKTSGQMGLLWILLLSFRWPFIMAVTTLGLTINETDPILDPEKVLPIVLNRYLPVFVKGFVVSGLIAAGMSTFDSTINAGAAYYVKDIYEAYINKEATQRQLLIHSRISSIVIVLIGLFLTLASTSINQVWGFLNLTLIGGMLSPLIFRWIWHRLTGFGFAGGMIGGLVAGTIQQFANPGLADIWSFVIVIGASSLIMVSVTFLTQETEAQVLYKFYRATRPPGWWGPVRQDFEKVHLDQIDEENKRDLLTAFVFAWPFHVSLFLMWMFLVVGQVLYFAGFLLFTASFGLAVWWFWFRHLGKTVPELDLLHRSDPKEIIPDEERENSQVPLDD